MLLPVGYDGSTAAWPSRCTHKWYHLDGLCPRQGGGALYIELCQPDSPPWLGGPGRVRTGRLRVSSSPSSQLGSVHLRQAVFGGTLNILAAGVVDHIDTVDAYYTADYSLSCAYTRRLLDYPYAVDKKIGDAGMAGAHHPRGPTSPP